MSFVIVASVGLGLAAAGGVTKSIMGKRQRDEARDEKEAEKATGKSLTRAQRRQEARKNRKKK